MDDFDHLSKIIEVYSKALLYEVRKSHCSERQKLFKDTDLQNYQQLVLQQLKTEVKIYNKATTEVLSIANIKANVYSQSVELRLLGREKLEDILRCCKLSFYTPFEPQELTSVAQCKAIYTDAAALAFERVKGMNLGSIGEALLFFDCILTDYLHTKSIDSEQLMTSCFRYNLQEDKDFGEMLNGICSDIC